MLQCVRRDRRPCSPPTHDDVYGVVSTWFVKLSYRIVDRLQHLYVQRRPVERLQLLKHSLSGSKQSVG